MISRITKWPCERIIVTTIVIAHHAAVIAFCFGLITTSRSASTEKNTARFHSEPIQGIGAPLMLLETNSARRRLRTRNVFHQQNWQIGGASTMHGCDDESHQKKATAYQLRQRNKRYRFAILSRKVVKKSSSLGGMHATSHLRTTFRNAGHCCCHSRTCVRRGKSES